MQPGVLASMLDDLLAATVASLTPDPDDETDPRTAPPDRQFVAHGPGSFAWDCPLVAVSLSGLVLEPQDPRGMGCAAIPVATLTVSLLRCYPDLDADGIPTADELTDAATVLAVDAAALAGGLAADHFSGDLFASANIACNKVTLGPLDPLGPLGGLAGWRFGVLVRP